MLGAEWTQLGGYGDGTVKVWFTAGMQQQGPRLASDAGSTASAAFGPAAGASWWSTTARRLRLAHLSGGVGAACLRSGRTPTSRAPSGSSSWADRLTRKCVRDALPTRLTGRRFPTASAGCVSRVSPGEYEFGPCGRASVALPGF